ncbi:phage baseplate assembly protein V [Streptomyces sp. NPDC006446]|uniref:phage baseplate assembly protein V n=1 Tax=Streptomyces sp. NPDC006446 TaxID=3154301 RepID=UPI0033BCDF9F
MGLLDVFGDTEPDRPGTDSRRLGIVRAEVTDNIDLTSQGRVQLKFPTIPDIEPWAPVCAPFAGDGYGLWCIPQVGDVVVVAFEHGDMGSPVVIGSVWDMRNGPPVDLPTDAVSKRVLKTPMGHELVLDDQLAEITLTHLAGHKITMTTDGITIELAQGVASVKLALPGTATVKGEVSAEMSAKKTIVKGDVNLDLSGAAASLQADATCQVKGGLVTIN